jgi:hypothetical protein
MSKKRKHNLVKEMTAGLMFLVRYLTILFIYGEDLFKSLNFWRLNLVLTKIEFRWFFFYIYNEAEDQTHNIVYYPNFSPLD